MTSGEPVTWRRLDRRMIWVDAIQSVLSLAPGALAVGAFGVEPTPGTMWPLLVVAVLGVASAAADALRWVFTRYRVTDEYVERRTGILLRQYRSVRRDRIRSVDATAKLRHRLAGLRVVTIGAGQQSAANESAFVLDALSTRDAAWLREVLLRHAPADAGQSAPAAEVAGAADGPADGPAGEPDAAVFARLRPSWVFYNMFNIWAYLVAAGLLWGTFWLASAVGLDIVGFIAGLLDWQTLGWGWSIAIGVVATGALGVLGLAVSFFTEYWRFELARVPGEQGTQLRTRQGLFTTREVNRDDSRLRGVEISEPVLWRWLGVADTNVITTGLALWSMASPTTILPRGPVSVARPVAAAVLGGAPGPLDAPLRRHPRAALRRRLWWATLVGAGTTGVLAWLAGTGVLPFWAVAFGVAAWPLALGCAVIAYRALGHTIAGDYLVVRSGLVSRSTAVLQRSAVSTIAVRESVLQRRLGLRTVSAMTAAGWGAYEAPDLAAGDAVAFAAEAAPGLLAPFLETDGDPPAGYWPTGHGHGHPAEAPVRPVLQDGGHGRAGAAL